MLHVYNFVLLVCLAEMLGFHILYVLCSYVMIGRSFFSVSLGTGRLADGVEFWRGYYQSIRPTQMGLSLNIGILLPFHFPFLLTPCHWLIVGLSCIYCIHMLCQFDLFSIVIVDASARPFYEPLMVHEYVQEYLNLRDLARPLSDAQRVKVLVMCSVMNKIFIYMICEGTWLCAIVSGQEGVERYHCGNKSSELQKMLQSHWSVKWTSKPAEVCSQ